MQKRRAAFDVRQDDRRVSAVLTAVWLDEVMLVVSDLPSKLDNMDQRQLKVAESRIQGVFDAISARYENDATRMPSYSGLKVFMRWLYGVERYQLEVDDDSGGGTLREGPGPRTVVSKL